MKCILIKNLIWAFFFILAGNVFSQIPIDKGDPPNNVDIPDYFKAKLSDIDKEIAGLKTGKAKVIATSPGGLPLYAVYYGLKDDFNRQANYNSAIGAGDVVYYADKEADAKPVVYFVGPVHGQEAEGIVGLVNLIHIAETGKDYRGKPWSELKEKIEKCRVIIIPCGNPDGRGRCPYDSFRGLPEEMMTKYGQGTQKDGILWRWPFVKSLHPMKMDANTILGAYFNDEGINIMHDEFFDPMAAETKAILDISRDEAPDIIVSLHSHGTGLPVIHQPAYLPWFMKERVAELAKRLKENYSTYGLGHMDGGPVLKPAAETEKSSFNLVSALHHVSGAMAFVFESDQGTIHEKRGILKPLSTYDDMLDVQLVLYNQMFDYVIESKKR